MLERCGEKPVPSETGLFMKRSVFASALCWFLMTLPAGAIEIKEVMSPGGIKAWLVEEHSLPLIAMSFSFDGGAATDPKDKAGLNYFLAAMLEEGAGDLNSEAFQNRRDELSVRIRFESTPDHFEGSFQALSENRDASFALLKLAITRPRFDPEPLERVRGQALLHIREHEESPEDIASDQWRKLVYPDHPYGRSDSGTAEGIAGITANDLRSSASTLFTRDRLKVVVVGDVDGPTVGRLLDATFGALPAVGKPLDVADAKAREGPVLTVVDRDIPQSIVRFGLPGIRRSDPDFLAAYVMNDILGGSGPAFGSRLIDAIREKRGLAYSVYSTLVSLDRGGLFIGGAATRNDKAIESVELVKSELKRFTEEGPTHQELADAKTYITGSYALRFDTTSHIADELLSIQQDDLGIDFVERRNRLVEAVTLKDVKRVARRLINSERLVITIVGRPARLNPQ
jgi:zinc protease